MSEIGTTIRLSTDFDSAVERVTEALSRQGFGVISRIDLDKAFEEKLGVAFRRYAILGACNPTLAHSAISARPEVGLLLPCNVVVEEAADATIVRIVDAATMMGVGDLGTTPEISELASDAARRLDAVTRELG